MALPLLPKPKVRNDEISTNLINFEDCFSHARFFYRIHCLDAMFRRALLLWTRWTSSWYFDGPAIKLLKHREVFRMCLEHWLFRSLGKIIAISPLSPAPSFLRNVFRFLKNMAVMTIGLRVSFEKKNVSIRVFRRQVCNTVDSVDSHPSALGRTTGDLLTEVSSRSNSKRESESKHCQSAVCEACNTSFSRETD